MAGVAKRPILLFVTAATVSLLLSSCSSAPAAKRPVAPSSSATFTYVNAPDFPFIRNFNPWSPLAPLGGDVEPLVYIDQYTGKVVPKLAVSYSYANGYRTLTFDLRHGVEWSDGEPFTSADVVFTIDMILRNPLIDLLDLSGIVQSVSSNGPYQVIIDLKAPNSTALYVVGSQTPIVQEKQWAPHASNPAYFADPYPVTTAPFLPESVSRSLITFVRNSHYWGKEPYVKYVKIPLYTSNTTATLAMVQGNFDLATIFIPSVQSTLVSHDPSQYHYWFPAFEENMLYTNDGTYPYSLLPLRQAISYAIDRSKVARLGEYGYETAANATGLPPMPAYKPFISKTLSQKPLPYDPTKAKSILKAAGFTWNSSGILIDPRGQAVAPVIIAMSGATDWIADAELIASQLKAIGIQASVNTPSAGTFLSDLADGDFQMGIYSTSSGPSPFDIYSPLLDSQFSAPEGQSAPSNYERWNSKATDNLLASYLGAFTQSQQRAVIVEVEHIMATQLPVIPLLDLPSWEEYNTTRFSGWPDAKNPYGDFAYNPFDMMYIIAGLGPAR